MAHFAEIDLNNIVRRVIVIDNSACGEPEVTFPETEALGQSFIANVLGLAGTWKQTSYNNNIRGNYAGIGFLYDEANDEFRPVSE